MWVLVLVLVVLVVLVLVLVLFLWRSVMCMSDVSCVMYHVCNWIELNCIGVGQYRMCCVVLCTTSWILLVSCCYVICRIAAHMHTVHCLVIVIVIVIVLSLLRYVCYFLVLSSFSFILQWIFSSTITTTTTKTTMIYTITTTTTTAKYVLFYYIVHTNYNSSMVPLFFFIYLWSNTDTLYLVLLSTS